MANKSKRQQLSEACRRAWNEFDPVGIARHYPEGYDVATDDAYDRYLKHTVELISSEADDVKLRRYVVSCYTSMGMPAERLDSEAVDRFVAQLAKLRDHREPR